MKQSLRSLRGVEASSAQTVSTVALIVTLFDPKIQQQSPDMFWDFHNKQVISIRGETNGGPDSRPAVLPYGEDYWQVGPIGKQWPSLGFEGQMIADRWKPQRPRKKQLVGDKDGNVGG